MTSNDTKIELVTEAIEALVLAQVIAMNPACNEHERHIAAKNVIDARKVIRDSLKTLLTPTLRIIDHIPAPDARPTYPAA